MGDKKRAKGLTARGKAQLSNNIVVGLFALLFLAPLYFFFINTFKEAKYMSTAPMYLTPEMFTTANIAEAFRLLKYPEAFMNSLFILALSIVLLVVLGSMAAFAIAIIGGKALNRLYFFLIALMTVPVYVAMIPLARQLANLHLINTHLGTSVVYVAFGLPFCVFLYVGNMRALPYDLYEAATIDGCSIYRVYLRIYMPLLKTVTGTIIILRGMYIWNDILMPLLTVRSGALQTLPQRLAALSTTNAMRWDIMFGASFLVSVPVIVLFLLLQKTFIQGIVDGSVKG